MGYISPIESYLPNFNSNMFQSSLLSPFQGESTDLYWNNELAAYNLDRFKLETPLLNPFYQQQYDPFANVMTDYSLLFKNNTLASRLDINLKTGLTLLNSSDTAAQLLGLLMILDNTALGTTPKQATQTPDVSHLTGADINYGQLFMQAGTQLAGLLASLIGGLGGQIASNVIKAGSSIYNAVSNIKEISTLAAAGVEGLGKAKAGNAMAIVGAVSDLAGSFLPEKTEYNGPKGDITLTLDSVYDGISDAAMSFGPVGMMVGGIMKGGAFLGKGMNALGGGTDGMCVCAGTKVFKANGEIVNIEDLKQEDGIIGWSEDTKLIVPLTIHDIIEPRLKECLEITTKSGFTLRCSIDHPILSDNNPKAKSHRINGQRIAYRDWKFRRADELKVGDFIGVANSIDYWGDISLNKAYLVGLLIGDGTYTKGNSCRLISADMSTWDYIESNGFGVINHCDDRRPDKYSTEIRTYRIIDGMDLMRLVGLACQSGKDKTLPKNIGQYTRESICLILAGLYDTDGSISVNEDKNSWSITLYQSNKNLLQEVKEQLHKLGIFASISKRKAALYQLGGKVINSDLSYRLEVGDIASAIRFTLFIPLNIDYKKANLYRIYNLLKDKKALEHPELSGAKLFKITDIKPIGLQTVYNLLADNDHTYLANGIITHNTTTDAILGSSFLSLTPIGLINGFGGQKADTITKNEEAFETVGASYTGSNQSVNSALQKSGKKYGLLSNSAREKANEEILKARLQQDIITDIADQATDRFAIRNSMAAINGNRRELAMQGGYNQAAIQFGRKGMVIAKRVARQHKMNKRRQEIQKVDPFEVYLLSLPENQRDTVNYRVRDYWEFNGRPKNFGEAIAKGMFTFENDGLWHAKSVSENPNTGEIEFMKPDTHPTHQLEIDWYNSDDGALFRLEYELVKSSPYWKYIKRKNPQEFKEGGALNNGSILMEIELDSSPQEFKEGGALNNGSILMEIELDSSPEEFKEGGKIDNVSVLVDIDSLPEEFKDGGVLGSSIIKEVEIEEMVEEFKEGGAFNVIPEGALHARLHHMENSENLTKKGIPVVSEGEGEELELHAEIEKEEIILRLSLTKRLEELAKENTDEAALEAGKILVEEILNNTIDNTNTLL